MLATDACNNLASAPPMGAPLCDDGTPADPLLYAEWQFRAPLSAGAVAVDLVRLVRESAPELLEEGDEARAHLAHLSNALNRARAQIFGGARAPLGVLLFYIDTLDFLAARLLNNGGCAPYVYRAPPAVGAPDGATYACDCFEFERLCALLALLAHYWSSAQTNGTFAARAAAFLCAADTLRALAAAADALGGATRERMLCLVSPQALSSAAAPPDEARERETRAAALAAFGANHLGGAAALRARAHLCVAKRGAMCYAEYAAVPPSEAIEAALLGVARAIIDAYDAALAELGERASRFAHFLLFRRHVWATRLRLGVAERVARELETEPEHEAALLERLAGLCTGVSEDHNAIVVRELGGAGRTLEAGAAAQYEPLLARASALYQAARARYGAALERASHARDAAETHVAPHAFKRAASSLEADLRAAGAESPLAVCARETLAALHYRYLCPHDAGVREADAAWWPTSDDARLGMAHERVRWADALLACCDAQGVFRAPPGLHAALAQERARAAEALATHTRGCAVTLQ